MFYYLDPGVKPQDDTEEWATRPRMTKKRKPQDDTFYLVTPVLDTGARVN